MPILFVFFRLCALAEANVNAISVFAIVSMLERCATRVM